MLTITDFIDVAYDLHKEAGTRAIPPAFLANIEKMKAKKKKAKAGDEAKGEVSEEKKEEEAAK